ncbi:hypothetical protein HDU96_006546 [Phlyctochytrium bullatum]|nr:hypothetical protein HDU96_006546 [Phlyctochytrium bullatum]
MTFSATPPPAAAPALLATLHQQQHHQPPLAPSGAPASPHVDISTTPDLYDSPDAHAVEHFDLKVAATDRAPRGTATLGCMPGGLLSSTSSSLPEAVKAETYTAVMSSTSSSFHPTPTQPPPDARQGPSSLAKMPSLSSLHGVAPALHQIRTDPSPRRPAPLSASAILGAPHSPTFSFPSLLQHPSSSASTSPVVASPIHSLDAQLGLLQLPSPTAPASPAGSDSQAPVPQLVFDTSAAAIFGAPPGTQRKRFGHPYHPHHHHHHHYYHGHHHPHHHHHPHPSPLGPSKSREHLSDPSLARSSFSFHPPSSGSAIPIPTVLQPPSPRPLSPRLSLPRGGLVPLNSGDATSSDDTDDPAAVDSDGSSTVSRGGGARQPRSLGRPASRLSANHLPMATRGGGGGGVPRHRRAASTSSAPLFRSWSTDTIASLASSVASFDGPGSPLVRPAVGGSLGNLLMISGAMEELVLGGSGFVGYESDGEGNGRGEEDGMEEDEEMGAERRPRVRRRTGESTWLQVDADHSHYHGHGHHHPHAQGGFGQHLGIAFQNSPPRGRPVRTFSSATTASVSSGTTDGDEGIVMGGGRASGGFLFANGGAGGAVTPAGSGGASSASTRGSSLGPGGGGEARRPPVEPLRRQNSLPMIMMMMMNEFGVKDDESVDAVGGLVGLVGGEAIQDSASEASEAEKPSASVGVDIPAGFHEVPELVELLAEEKVGDTATEEATGTGPMPATKAASAEVESISSDVEIPVAVTKRSPLRPTKTFQVIGGGQWHGDATPPLASAQALTPNVVPHRASLTVPTPAPATAPADDTLHSPATRRRRTASADSFAASASTPPPPGLAFSAGDELQSADSLSSIFPEALGAMPASTRGLFDAAPGAGPEYGLDPAFAAKYRLGDVLGRGASGFVASAVRREDGVETAVKFILKDRIPPAGWKRDRGLGRMVPVEVFTLRRLEHPNIVRFLDLFEDATFFYFVQESVHAFGSEPAVASVISTATASSTASPARPLQPHHPPLTIPAPATPPRCLIMTPVREAAAAVLRIHSGEGGAATVRAEEEAVSPGMAASHKASEGEGLPLPSVLSGAAEYQQHRADHTGQDSMHPVSRAMAATPAIVIGQYNGSDGKEDHAAGSARLATPVVASPMVAAVQPPAQLPLILQLSHANHYHHHSHFPGSSPTPAAPPSTPLPSRHGIGASLSPSSDESPSSSTRSSIVENALHTGTDGQAELGPLPTSRRSTVDTSPAPGVGVILEGVQGISKPSTSSGLTPPMEKAVPTQQPNHRRRKRGSRRPSQDLFECIERNPRMPEDVARVIFAQIVDAVLYMHVKGYVHRDIKDENVIIDDSLRVKLIDFGTARPIPTSQADYFDDLCGTLVYSAPEVLAGQRYRGPEADVWSLGVLLFILVVGIEVLTLTPKHR